MSLIIKVVEGKRTNRILGFGREHNFHATYQWFIETSYRTRDFGLLTNASKIFLTSQVAKNDPPKVTRSIWRVTILDEK